MTSARWGHGAWSACVYPLSTTPGIEKSMRSKDQVSPLSSIAAGVVRPQLARPLATQQGQPLFGCCRRLPNLRRPRSRASPGGSLDHQKFPGGTRTVRQQASLPGLRFPRRPWGHGVTATSLLTKPLSPPVGLGDAVNQAPVLSPRSPPRRARSSPGGGN